MDDHDPNETDRQRHDRLLEIHRSKLLKAVELEADYFREQRGLKQARGTRKETSEEAISALKRDVEAARRHPKDYPHRRITAPLKSISAEIQKWFKSITAEKPDSRMTTRPTRQEALNHMRFMIDNKKWIKEHNWPVNMAQIHLCQEVIRQTNPPKLDDDDRERHPDGSLRWDQWGNEYTPRDPTCESYEHFLQRMKRQHYPGKPQRTPYPDDKPGQKGGWRVSTTRDDHGRFSREPGEEG